MLPVGLLWALEARVGSDCTEGWKGEISEEIRAQMRARGDRRVQDVDLFGLGNKAVSFRFIY